MAAKIWQKYSGAEALAIQVLEEATMIDLLMSQIWKHKTDFGEAPTMIEVAASLYRSTSAAYQKLTGKFIHQKDFGIFYLDDVLISFVHQQDPTCYLQIYGSKPSHRWSL